MSLKTRGCRIHGSIPSFTLWRASSDVLLLPAHVRHAGPGAGKLGVHAFKLQNALSSIYEHHHAAKSGQKWRNRSARYSAKLRVEHGPHSDALGFDYARLSS